MNLYFLFEGKRTEKKVYRSWLRRAFPSLDVVHRPEDVTDNTIRLVTGGGYPQYLELIRIVFEEIRKAGESRVDHWFICIDAEDLSFEDRYEDVSRRVEELSPAVEFSVIVQNCCIETWLLGHRRLLKHTPEGHELLACKAWYDVSEHDPEYMEPMPSWNRSKARFHEHYLKAMLRECGLSYSKKKPSKTADGQYLTALVERFDSTQHIQSFGRLIKTWRGLGAEI